MEFALFWKKKKKEDEEPFTDLSVWSIYFLWACLCLTRDSNSCAMLPFCFYFHPGGFDCLWSIVTTIGLAARSMQFMRATALNIWCSFNIWQLGTLIHGLSKPLAWLGDALSLDLTLAFWSYYCYFCLSRFVVMALFDDPVQAPWHVIW